MPHDAAHLALVASQLGHPGDSPARRGHLIDLITLRGRLTLETRDSIGHGGVLFRVEERASRPER